MPMDEEKRMSKGFAFVEFHTLEVGCFGKPQRCSVALSYPPSTLIAVTREPLLYSRVHW